ncbi:translation initiation factor IF3-1, mitochondrial-like isoform X2 [Syzygium oleosum]|uniref:translation initiation factor IF3-1, mitochondrial-like isoform X2 n=1 Tax=Syzygium oleosum TaxID=219896 RepID=UPI0011D20B7E|nr:translation initiation factor IF3-1, mitochondrial-like isoform X2 [Syzygium oleosum]
MVFWYRLHQSKLRHASSYIKSCYAQSVYASAHDCAASSASIGVKPAPLADIRRRPTDFCSNVRFFAAPVQARPKEDAKDSNAPCLNEKIKASIVRVVTDEGHFVVSIHEALQRARKLNLDLVEVQKNANPPVCKIMDFHREKYKQQLKEKDRAKSQSGVTLRKGDCKEVRFTGKTEQKDLKMKAETVKRLMERGYRVKCRAMGTEDQDLGGLLTRLSALIEDVAVVESGPRVEKQQAYVIVRHAKFGPSKSGKKLFGDTKQYTVARPSGDSEDEDLGEKGLESEKEMLSNNGNAAGSYAGWSTGGANYGSKVNDRPGRAPSSSNPNYSMNMGEPSTETENRYVRGGANNRFTQSWSQGARDSDRLQPEVPRSQEVPNQRRQEVPYQRRQDVPYQRRQSPSDTRTSHLTGESKQVETPPSPSRSSFGLFSAPRNNTPGNHGEAPKA